jgi:hypothetical protein
MFASGIIVSDRKNILRDLIRTAKSNWKKGPKKLTSVKRAWIDYDISTYLQDIDDCIHENNPAHLIFNYAANEFVNYDYRLRNIWMPRPKDRMDDLKKRSPRIYKLIIEINTISNWKLRAKRVIALGKLVGNRNKLQLTGEMYVPPSKAHQSCSNIVHVCAQCGRL